METAEHFVFGAIGTDRWPFLFARRIAPGGACRPARAPPVSSAGVRCWAAYAVYDAQRRTV
jgi:hypothetical protein